MITMWFLGTIYCILFSEKNRLYLQLREDAVKSWLIWTTVEFDISWNYHHLRYPGWWFGTCFFFFHSVGNNNPNWLIFFQRGRYTNNQYHMIERKYAIKLGDKTSFQRALGGGLARQSLVLATSPSLCSCACSTLRSRSDVGSCCCERFQKNRLELWSNIFQPGYEVDWSYIYIHIHI